MATTSDPMVHVSRSVVLALAVGIALACGTINENELQCEEALSRLSACCPGFDSSVIGCFEVDGGCNGDSTAPALSVDESECIRGESCAQLVANGVCARGQSARSVTSSPSDPELQADAPPPAPCTAQCVPMIRTSVAVVLATLTFAHEARAEDTSHAWPTPAPPDTTPAPAPATPPKSSRFVFDLWGGGAYEVLFGIPIYGGEFGLALGGETNRGANLFTMSGFLGQTLDGIAIQEFRAGYTPELRLTPWARIALGFNFAYLNVSGVAGVINETGFGPGLRPSLTFDFAPPGTLHPYLSLGGEIDAVSLTLLESAFANVGWRF